MRRTMLTLLLGLFSAAGVEASEPVLEPAPMDQASLEMTAQEYTVAGFDIEPYLPGDQNAALFQVLAVADDLAHAAANDGIPYKQHGWGQGSDDANLRKGIDCSRAIWFAFTRAGLPYNRQDRYLPTADMVTRHTWMQDEFQRCNPNSDLRIGDIIVYRDQTRGDGHVVMVIDPKKRIAWGSHGWDGNALQGYRPDTGVEYQLIKVKKDWQRWDRRTMKFAACWRYRGFSEPVVARREQPEGGRPSDRPEPGLYQPGPQQPDPHPSDRYQPGPQTRDPRLSDRYQPGPQTRDPDNPGRYQPRPQRPRQVPETSRMGLVDLFGPGLFGRRLFDPERDTPQPSHARQRQTTREEKEDVSEDWLDETTDDDRAVDDANDTVILFKTPDRRRISGPRRTAQPLPRALPRAPLRKKAVRERDDGALEIDW